MQFKLNMGFTNALFTLNDFSSIDKYRFEFALIDCNWIISVPFVFFVLLIDDGVVGWWL